MTPTWTEESIAMLKSDYAARVRTVVICDHIGRLVGHAVTRSTILGKLYRLGLLKAKAKPEPKPKPKPGRRLPPTFGMYVADPLPVRFDESREPITMDELNATNCHYPVDTLTKGLCYCGAPAYKHSSWCRHHFNICTVTKDGKART